MEGQEGNNNQKSRFGSRWKKGMRAENIERVEVAKAIAKIKDMGPLQREKNFKKWSVLLKYSCSFF